MGVLILGVASLWSALRTPKVPAYAGKARRFGVAALALMILAIWIGVALQIERSVQTLPETGDDDFFDVV